MGDAQEKFEELIRTIDNVLELCEDSSKLDHASESAIEEVFTVTASLEKFYRKAQQTGCLDTMQLQVLEYWKQKGRNVPSELAVLEEACDLVLTACFHCQFLSDKSLCVAVQEYERHCGDHRLQELVVHLLRDGISCQLLHSMALSPPTLLSRLSVGWQNMIECGQASKVRALVSTNLQRNVTLTNSILLLIVKPDQDNDDNTSLKTLLLDCVMNEMKGKNSKTFCACLVNSVDATVLVSVAECYPNFLTILLETFQVLALGAVMKCQRVEGRGVEYKWKDLGFPLVLVQQLCKCEGPVGCRTLSWLSMLQARHGGSLWEDVAACCGV